MTLEIVGVVSRKDYIRLKRSVDSVLVYIGDNHVATFFDDGKFVYHGTSYNQYEDRWKDGKNEF